MDEWIDDTIPYLVRVDHLTNGGGKNGTTVLNATTVLNDGVVDDLRGGNGADYFIAHTAGAGPFDLLTDRSPKGERLLVI